MSDYFDDFPNNYDSEGEENPFADLPGWSNEPEIEDPYEKIEEEVLGNLGIESYDDIVFDLSSIDPDTIRGNRFENLQDAIAYLFDSGVLRFSGVVIQEEEIEISIDDCTQPPCD